MATTYWQKWGLKGKVVAVVRVTDEGVAQSWAWGRWVDIPSDALPDRDETMVDVITEAEVWMPTRVELEDHVAALEEERRANSPVQNVGRAMATTGAVSSGRTRRSTFPASGTKWDESVDDVFPPPRR